MQQAQVILAPIINRLRETSTEIGKLPRKLFSDDENNLDAASESIQDAIEELEEIINRS